MSKIADNTYNILTGAFPFDNIIKEYYVNYKNSRLFFDFYIKSIGVFIECDGQQHYKFVKHFHGSIENFYAQRRRDQLKDEWAEINGKIIIRLLDSIDNVTEELILRKIYDKI
jgi:very-short-patch-repair endonuclease